MYVVPVDQSAECLCADNSLPGSGDSLITYVIPDSGSMSGVELLERNAFTVWPRSAAISMRK